MDGLSDVPGRLRDVVRDAGGGLRAVPYLWSPQLLLARRRLRLHPPTSLRTLFSLRGAARAALPDSPLELALAARYLGLGDPFALERDELAAAREVFAPAARCCISIPTPRPALALPPRRDRSRARQRLRARRSARRCHRELPGEGTIATSACSASSRARGAPSARGASPAACWRPGAGAAGRRARPDAGARGHLRSAFGGCLHGAPADALADAREQRDGRCIQWPRRASRGGRSGWGNGCCCGADGPRARRCRIAGELLGSQRCSPRAATCGPSTGPAELAATSLSSLSVRWASALAWLRLPRQTASVIPRPRRTGSGSRSRATASASRTTIERYNGAKFRLQQTMGRIHENEVRLSTARVNLRNARHALNISLISAYKNPRPDPLQAALEARNFGQVLEQFSLLDRAQTYNASILTDIRDYRKDVDEPARAQPRAQRPARHGRRAGLAARPDPRARSRPTSGATTASSQGAAPHRGAPPGRDRGLAARSRAARQLQARHGQRRPSP